MANETRTYSRYVYQVVKDAAIVATFCIRQDAEEMATKVGGTVYVIGAY